ncbi:MAG: ABC transporter permease, partial [Acidobacteriaceae bacterium]|nr:ABC transporter permease [Acidobacteriaceae bacterium]
MRLLSVFISRLRAAVSSSPGDDQEFDEEIRSHIDLLTDRYRREGLTATEAKAAARRQFGRTTRLKEHVHDQGTILWLETILQDVRYSLRYLQKSPLFCFTAVFTLALGIGVNTAVFSIFYAVLLRPLPFKNADQLTMIWEQNQHRGWDHNIVSAANFNDWNRQNHVFTGMALIDPFITFNLSGSEAPVVVRAERVTPNLFSLLGVQPFIGRSFLPEEGRPGSRAVILGYSLWKGRYASDPSIVGKQLSLNNENYTVIGVLPAGFDGEFMRESEGAEVWVAGLDLSDPGRNDHNFIAIARLRDGITLQKAQAEMTALAARLQQQYPEDKDWSVGLVSLHDELVGNSRPALLILLVGVSLVLLIACTNLANVLLARGMARLREFA